jgi:hypothetical protein
MNNEIDLVGEINYGNGKYFPTGPTCHFRGQDVPCLTLWSPSGSITADLLVTILKYLDGMNLYPRNIGDPIIFLVVEGHDSRLSPSFIDYIAKPIHKWRVNLGIPYATSYWQVGDSSEQNGHFKCLLSVTKRNIAAYI